MKNSIKTNESEKIAWLLHCAKTALSLAQKEAREAQKEISWARKNDQSPPQDAMSQLDFYNGKVAQAKQFLHALKMVAKGE